MLSNVRQQKILLRAHGLCKSFGGQLVLDELEFELQQGDIILLRGDNGSGKTTLLNILTGNVEPNSGEMEIFTNEPTEIFHFPRSWWANLNPRDHFTPERLAGKAIGRTWQEIRLFSSQRVFENLAVSSPDQTGENPSAVLFRRSQTNKDEQINSVAVQEMLKELELTEIAEASASKISLGQSKRVAIGRAIRAGARILFLDEPLAGLDAPGVRNILDLLKKLASNGKITLVIIEHLFNIPHILGLATKVWTLKNGKLQVEPVQKVHAEITSELQDGPHDFIHSLTNDAGGVLTEPLGRGALMVKVKVMETTEDLPILEIDNLVVRRGDRVVLGYQEADGATYGLNFALKKGELAFLQAPNGWGKTTLLEAIMGLIPITRGDIKFCGQSITRMDAWDRAQLGLTFLQSQRHSFPSLTVRENLRLAKVIEMPDTLTPLLERQLSNLSGGEKQKVAIACAKRKHQVGFYDEPFAALDPAGIRRLWANLTKGDSALASLVALPNVLEITAN